MNWRRFNCYAYAINKRKWLLMPDYYNPEYLLSRNPTWKLVNKSDMVLGKKYIAYRYCSHDFHFMKRDEKGHWRHKRGSYRPEVISQKKVFSDAWENDGFYYTSKIYLFEVN